jgi:hypothetical protein
MEEHALLLVLVQPISVVVQLVTVDQNVKIVGICIFYDLKIIKIIYK